MTNIYHETHTTYFFNEENEIAFTIETHTDLSITRVIIHTDNTSPSEILCSIIPTIAKRCGESKDIVESKYYKALATKSTDYDMILFHI